jgi:hypothetical protein
VNAWKEPYSLESPKVVDDVQPLQNGESLDETSVTSDVSTFLVDIMITHDPFF